MRALFYLILECFGIESFFIQIKNMTIMKKSMNTEQHNTKTNTHTNTQHHQNNQTKNTFHILIIGGGISGLSLAHKYIHDKRWKNLHITLMERKDRYGGRVKTMRVSSSKQNIQKKPDKQEWYEAGCSRVAESHHRVRNLAKACHCIEMVFDDSYDHHKEIHYLKKISNHTNVLCIHGEEVCSPSRGVMY